MEILKKEIKDLCVFTPKTFPDSRGYFMESFRQDEFEKKVGKINFVQENESCSSFGVLRGLHFQKEPHAQSKLVRCVVGKILDVAVDLRPESPNFGKYESVELSEENKKQFFIPKGFAHGFLALSKKVVVQYKVDNYYAPQSEAGIIWNEPTVNVDWQFEKYGIDEPILSNKDKDYPTVKRYLESEEK